MKILMKGFFKILLILFLCGATIFTVAYAISDITIMQFLAFSNPVVAQEMISEKLIGMLIKISIVGTILGIFWISLKKVANYLEKKEQQEEYEALKNNE
ncbi:hypothetical protein [Bacillus cereus group sp. BfR-BA-01351]|uniref:hypothetical protein n=1 Tax=unclassified Bacillus cereus group TaxID=2750818 RepID=UPI001F58D33F|nr:hypothetical protein [Bacillus cereus group sp. BfR-BA-01351]MDA2609977.1 hypothetical protein [Bacillus cereus]MEB9975330.1 hypothetical protein [Bacillus cereus]